VIYPQTSSLTLTTVRRPCNDRYRPRLLLSCPASFPAISRGPLIRSVVCFCFFILISSVYNLRATNPPVMSHRLIILLRIRLPHVDSLILPPAKYAPSQLPFMPPFQSSRYFQIPFLPLYLGSAPLASRTAKFEVLFFLFLPVVAETSLVCLLPMDSPTHFWINLLFMITPFPPNPINSSSTAAHD